jgi:quercetin dioxygenase-like cupin family protein
MQVAEADFGPDVNPALANAIHTHSGPEIWYLLTGEQCLETPGGVTRARAGEGMFVQAETPMQLRIVGPSKRDALFVIIHDAARPATTVSAWHPKGSCDGKL